MAVREARTRDHLQELRDRRKYAFARGVGSIIALGAPAGSSAAAISAFPVADSPRAGLRRAWSMTGRHLAAAAALHAPGGRTAPASCSPILPRP